MNKCDYDWLARAQYNKGARMRDDGEDKPRLNKLDMRLSCWLLAGWNDADISLARQHGIN